MRRISPLIVCALAASPLLAVAVANCGGDGGDPKPSTTDAGISGSGGAGGSGAGGEGEGGGFMIPDAGNQGGAGGCGGTGGCSDVGPVCGDGSIDPGEKCDDSNANPGDGCAANCLSVENDWSCPTPGEPCVSTVVCGDAKVSGTETCDDQNTTPGDGCDSVCQVEPGWKCLDIGKKCEAAACGDGLIVGKEECEDGNAAPGDGCDAACRLEYGWKCPNAGAPCEPTVCGDGLVEGKEPCDDGNNNMGDGCTPFCVREPDCAGGACTSTCGDGLKLPNSNEQCEDGNTASGDGCSADCQIEQGFGCQDVVQNGGNTLQIPLVLRDFKIAHPDFEDYNGAEKNIVAAALGADGKPVYANQGGTTATTTGAANFNQWYNDVAGVNQTVLQTMTLTKLMAGGFQFNNPSFFQLDGIGWGNEGNNHNFHFTSEVRYWFEYKGGEQLDFTGDDDVWVFVNKKLALDLGGVHGPQSGSVVLNAANAAVLGLVIGKVYETVVFQAERHTSGSNYKLTLSNFINTQSVCTSVCGDGIVTPDEVCDDGVNDGSYGSCTADCNKGPYCGDAIVQAAGNEECDDGVNLTPYGGCAPGCKQGSYCGDGVVDSLFGEQCDDTVNDGGYEECASGCLLGPRCGDGVVQPAQEECDDGNKSAGDGCSPKCKNDTPT